jgi:hypothetical protein
VTLHIGWSFQNRTDFDLAVIGLEWGQYGKYPYWPNERLKIFNLKNPRFIERLKVIKIWYIKI